MSTWPILPLCLALLACGDGSADGPPAGDGGSEDAEVQLDGGGPQDAWAGDAEGARDGGTDGGPAELDAGADDAGPGPCANPCPLHPSDFPASCSDRWRSCRIDGCRTYCGDVSMSPKGEGDACAFTVDCDRGMQCLEAPGALQTCRRFCRIGESDCTGALECVRIAGLRNGEDGAAVTLPEGIGICD